jgi:amphi-Trp domain-containing protein
VKKQMELGKGVDYLQAVIDSLRAGKVCVEHGEESLSLTPPGNVTVSVKARRREEKESISIKLAWRTVTEEEAPEPELKISAETPSGAPTPSAT